MKKRTTTQIRYLPKHIADDPNAWNSIKLTDKFRLTGKWGIVSQYHPEVMIGSTDPISPVRGYAAHTSHTMRIEAEITDSYVCDNPEYVELTWYQSRVEHIDQQPMTITITYTAKYWIDEDDFCVTDRYDPEWVEFDCNVAES